MPTKKASEAGAARTGLRSHSRRHDNDRNGAPAVAVTQVRQALGLTRKAFARMTGFSERALAGWESGEKISELGRRRLREMQRLERALARVMKRDFIPPWLDTPKEEFYGLKPLEGREP